MWVRDRGVGPGAAGVIHRSIPVVSIRPLSRSRSAIWLRLAAGGTRTGRTRFLLDGADAISLGPGETFSQSVAPADGASEELLTVTVEGDRVEITAVDTGEAALSFELWADGERRWIAPPLPVEID